YSPSSRSSGTSRSRSRIAAAAAMATETASQAHARDRTDTRATALFSQVRPADIGVVRQLGGGSRERDRAGLQHVPAVRDRERHRGVLLDEQDRHALSIDVADRIEDLLDHYPRPPPPPLAPPPPA